MGDLIIDVFREEVPGLIFWIDASGRKEVAIGGGGRGADLGCDSVSERVMVRVRCS